eukprot:3540287-Rhodomonas_salina.1
MEVAKTRSTDGDEAKTPGEFNEIEAEVILFQRSSSSWAKSGKSSDKETSEDEFGRAMFRSKKAHRVACLLASARLISSFANEKGDRPVTLYPETDPVF